MGLGWTLNPGAITRNVNGFADDLKDATEVNRYFWEGGVTRTYQVGLTVGAKHSPGSVSFGLAFSQDTFQGSGLGLDVSVGSTFNGLLGANDQSLGGPGIKASIGVSPYGDPSASAGLTYEGKQKASGLAKNGSGSVGISTNFKSVQAKANAGVSGVGASMTTGRNGTSIGVQAGRLDGSWSNSKRGKVSTSSMGLGLSIPIAPLLSISLGYNVQRYWIDETESTTVNGVLNLPQGPVTKDLLDDHHYDVYSMPDPLDRTYFLKDPERSLGGSYPNYDNYYVHAQGVQGYFRPYLYQRYLFRKNKYQVKEDSEGHDYNYYQSVNFSMGNVGKPVQFRFINDFSNRYQYGPADITINTGSTTNPLSFTFTGNPLTGESGSEGYIENENRLPGSRDIVYLTNADIIGNSSKTIQSGFMNPVATGFNRSAQNADLIGAYVITNESGVRYHFGLPAMSSKEYFYSENTDQQEVETFNEFKKEEPYAYTWFLTGVTGADYVDRGPGGPADGIMNEYDWGYWVQFEYGKWTDSYAWRNPGDGLAVDLDTQFGDFSEGIKELYYLDAVRTKTHTAFFIKDIRNDAKSSLRFRRDTNQNREILNNLSKEGGYLPTDATCTCYKTGIHENNIVEDEGVLNYVAKPTSTLRLSKILLMQNNDLVGQTTGKDKGVEYALNDAYDWTPIQNGIPPATIYPKCDFTSVTSTDHQYQNVLDVYDATHYLNTLEDKAVRVIELKTDYSLAKETPNSFDPTLVQGTPNPDPNTYPLTGKLTLNEVHFLGKGGADFIPPMKFDYELDAPKNGTGQIAQEGTDKYSFNLSNTPFQAGDMVQAIGVYYGVIVAIQGDKHILRVIGETPPVVGQTYNWIATKNPPYRKDFYDIWNNYKSDFVQMPANYENIKRFPSKVSAKSVDAWSLRGVRTSLGSILQINYESDSYTQSVFHKNFSFPLHFQSETVYDPDEHDLPLYRRAYLTGSVSADSDIKLNQLYSPGEEVDLVALYGDCSGPCTPAAPIHSGTVMTVSATNIKIKAFDYNLPDGGPNDDKVFYGGQLYFGSNVLNQGGGVRVKSIGISDVMSGKTNATTYDYQNGTTSYEPVKMDQYDLGITNSVAKADFAYYVNLSISKLVAIGNFIPPPGVIYQTVTVRETVSDGISAPTPMPNYSEYEFKTFDQEMVDVDRPPRTDDNVTQHQYYEGIDVDQLHTRNITIKDFTTNLGALKRITLFDNDGNKLAETVNHFSFDEENIEDAISAYGNQGVIEESFAEALFARRYFLGNDEELETFSINGTVTKKVEYPSIQTGQTNINFKTGISTTSSTVGFDFYSGRVTKTLATDGFGNTFLTENIPAYRQYAEMGPMALGGKNMLTQEGGSIVFKVDPSNASVKLGLVSATAQTWSKNLPVAVLGSQSAQKIYRQHATFSWIGNDQDLNADGLYPINAFTSFDAWTTGTPSAQWQKNGEITLYDPNSHALEAKDVNGNFAATKMSSDYNQVFASVANGAYQEFAYSGAEDKVVSGAYGGDVQKKDATEVYRANDNDKITTHTGSKALRLTSTGSKAFEYTFTGKANRTYRASVWANHADGKIKYSLNGVVQTVSGNYYNGGETLASKKAGAWNLVNLDILVGTQPAQIVVWCETAAASCNFDDFRIHPLDGPMTSYVYNQWGELSHILDNNNLYTEYQYDEMGRLSRTFRETLHQNSFWGPNYGDQGIVKVSEIGYNYGANYEEGSDRDGLEVMLIKAAAPVGVTFTGTVDFGYPPFNYKWYLNGSLMSETNTSDYESSYNTTEACPYSVRLQITDARESVRNLYEYGGSDNLALSWGFDNPVKYQPITYGVNITSGNCGPYSYSWKIMSTDGQTVHASGTSSTITHTFSGCGDYRVVCTVRGPNGQNSKSALGFVHVEGEDCGPIH